MYPQSFMLAWGEFMLCVFIYIPFTNDIMKDFTQWESWIQRLSGFKICILLDILKTQIRYRYAPRKFNWYLKLIKLLYIYVQTWIRYQFETTNFNNTWIGSRWNYITEDLYNVYCPFIKIVTIGWTCSFNGTWNTHRILVRMAPAHSKDEDRRIILNPVQMNMNGWADINMIWN